MSAKTEGDCPQHIEGMTIHVTLLDVLLPLEGATMTLLLAVRVPVTAAAERKGGGKAADISFVVPYPVLVIMSYCHSPFQDEPEAIHDGGDDLTRQQASTPAKQQTGA